MPVTYDENKQRYTKRVKKWKDLKEKAKKGAEEVPHLSTQNPIVGVIHKQYGYYRINGFFYILGDDGRKKLYDKVPNTKNHYKYQNPIHKKHNFS